jgi:hypothetical protein
MTLLWILLITNKNYIVHKSQSVSKRKLGVPDTQLQEFLN